MTAVFLFHTIRLFEWTHDFLILWIIVVNCMVRIHMLYIMCLRCKKN